MAEMGWPLATGLARGELPNQNMEKMSLADWLSELHSWRAVRPEYAERVSGNSGQGPPVSTVLSAPDRRTGSGPGGHGQRDVDGAPGDLVGPAGHLVQYRVVRAPHALPQQAAVPLRALRQRQAPLQYSLRQPVLVLDVPFLATQSSSAQVRA